MKRRNYYLNSQNSHKPSAEKRNETKAANSVWRADDGADLIAGRWWFLGTPVRTENNVSPLYWGSDFSQAHS
jgi:hypothetical protein